MPSNIPGVSWREQKSLQKKSPGRESACTAPVFRVTLFIVLVSEHIAPLGRLEGTSKPPGFSAPSAPCSWLGKEAELCDPAHHVVSSVFPDTCFPSRLIWQGSGHPLPCQRCEAGTSKLHHLIAVCLGLVTELPFASVFPPIKWE